MDVKIFDKITAELVENGTISIEDREIYRYGLKRIITMFLDIATTLIIGFVLNAIWQSVLFMVTYVPLRSYAGGAHARTPMKCYVFSVILTVCVLVGVKHIPYNNTFLLIAVFVSGLVIFIFAPIGDENKPLDEVEIKVFRRRTRIVLFLEIGLIGLFITFNLNFIAVCCVISLVCASFLLVISVLKKVFLFQNE